MIKETLLKTWKELVHWLIAASISIVITVIGVTAYHVYHHQSSLVKECR